MGMSIASPPIPEYVELSAAGEVTGPGRLICLYPQLFLGLLTVALGYAVFRTGGVEFSDWDLSLLLIGFASVFYVLRAHSLAPFSSTSRWLVWLTILFPAYVAFQLLPLPLWL